MGVSWLAIYASEHATARLRKAQLAALKAKRGRQPEAGRETKEVGDEPWPNELPLLGTNGSSGGLSTNGLLLRALLWRPMADSQEMIAD